jgi:hypothetical protein
VALELGVPPSNILALRAFFEEATSVYSAMARSMRGRARSDGLQRLQELAAPATQGMVSAAMRRALCPGSRAQAPDC